jgi:peroxiredoxin Q/BCP
MSLNIGTMAPNFTSNIDGGGEVNLSDYSGKKVVLYFYPKDDTSGCTKQACGFKDNMERITTTGAVVLGVSPDSVNSHNKFRDKYDLNFNLVSDETKEIATNYDVWVEKSMYGKKYMGVERTTFIIDEKGEIIKVYSKVKVDGHIEKVIEDLNNM